MSSKIKMLVYSAVFIAISVALSFYSPYFGDFRVSLAPVVIMFAGAALGPVQGGIIGASTDLLTYLIRPLGAFFPGFTLTMAVYGLLAGIFFYRRKDSEIGYIRICLVMLLVQVLCSVLLNTLWQTILSGNEFSVMLVTRLPNTGISYVMYTLLMAVLIKNRNRIVRGVSVASKTA